MNGGSDEDILNERKEIIQRLTAVYPNEEIEVIDSFITEEPNENVKSIGLWYLGQSLELMSKADIVVFVPNWGNARGCRIEYDAAEDYGLTIIFA